MISNRCQRLMRSVLACMLASGGWWLASAVAGVPSVNSSLTAIAADIQVQQWIDDLGSPIFATRESATQHLIRQGHAVIARVAPLRESADRELRIRAQRMVREIARRSRPERLRRFLAGGSLADELQLPCWTLMRQIAGDGMESRRLWVQALLREWDFLDELASKADQAPAVLNARLIQQARQRGARMPTESVVALMIGAIHTIGTDAPAAAAAADRNTVAIFGMLNRLAAAGPQEAAWGNAEFRRVVSAFIVAAAGPTSVYQGLTLTMRYDLPDTGLAAAERALTSGIALPHVRQYAMLALARFGNESHKPMLEELLDDQGVLFAGKISGVHGKKIECQVRDMALVCLMHLDGVDPREQGFRFVQRTAAYVFQPHTVGFADPAQRTQTFAQYRGLAAVPLTPDTSPAAEDSGSPGERQLLLEAFREQR